MNQEEKKIVDEVKKSFTKMYTVGNNDEEVMRLIGLLGLQGGKRYLDLGTGSGYVAFCMADLCNDILIDGLDVVTPMIERNKQEALSKGLGSVDFYVYEGIEFPFEDEAYDGLIVRFALHHFPNIDKTLEEMSRVLKKDSKIVICDCVRHERDEYRFIDKWMKVFGDGHVSFTDEKDYCDKLAKYGYRLSKRYDTVSRFHRINDERYMQLLNENSDVAVDYEYEIEQEKIWLTTKVVNLCFERKSN